MVAAGAGARGAGGRHREAGEHERLGERDQEVVVVDAVLAVQQRGGGGAGERHREAVDGLAALARGQPPVRDRRQVGDDVADPGAAHPRVARAHVVEVDDDRDRHLHAERGLAPVLLERGHRRGDAVVGEARRDRDHREPAERRGVLGGVERPAAADADDGVEEARAQPRAQVRRRLDRAALDHPDVGVGELRPQDLRDLLALPGPDRDRDVAAAGDPAVGEQRRQAAPPRRARCRWSGAPDHPGQQRHATSRARSRSAWSSTSTHSSPPTDATPTRPPRSPYSWKPSS